MAAWLLWAQHRALEPGAIVPAATLLPRPEGGFAAARIGDERILRDASSALVDDGIGAYLIGDAPVETLARSEEHTSELQSLMRISYAVFCLKKKKTNKYKQP